MIGRISQLNNAGNPYMALWEDRRMGRPDPIPAEKVLTVIKEMNDKIDELLRRLEKFEREHGSTEIDIPDDNGGFSAPLPKR